MSDWQAVYEAVRDRGYRNGWTTKEFLARQIAKMQEELGELSYLVVHPNAQLGADIEFVSSGARKDFDEGKEFWEKMVADINEDEFPKLFQEIADMQVVLCCMWGVARELASRDSGDLMEWALKKAQADVDRGVR